MKGFRFYLEHDSKRDKRKGIHEGNCVAVLLDSKGSLLFTSSLTVEAIGSVFNTPNSPCAGTAVHRNYLRQYCKRISEKEARKIHPNLFLRLEEGA